MSDAYLTDRYLELLAAGGPRYSIDGAHLGPATEAHRAAAILMLFRRAEPRWHCWCGAWACVIGPGSGPHHEALRCADGHWLKWLPKPRGASTRRRRP